MTDPITDMFNRIRNAQAVSKKNVSMPFSNLKYRIANILLEKGFVSGVEKKGRQTSKIIEIELKYLEDNSPIITGIKRVSKPGQRIYSDSKSIKKIRGGYGMSIISTSKGLMSNSDARKNNIGGEIICEVW